MSQAQEERRERMWESVHKESFEKAIVELQAMKARLDTIDQKSEEYKKLKTEYDERYESLEASYIKLRE